MAQRCVVTGKQTRPGMQRSIRGIAKKKGGIGLNIQGQGPRLFKANVHKKRFFSPELGRFITLKVCAKAMKTINKDGVDAVRRKVAKQAK